MKKKGAEATKNLPNPWYFSRISGTQGIYSSETMAQWEKSNTAFIRANRMRGWSWINMDQMEGQCDEAVNPGQTQLYH